MKLLTTALVAVFGILVVGCGSSPESLCNDSARALCDKAHECTAEADKVAAWTAIFGADADACFDTWSGSGAMDCANATDENMCSDPTPNYDSGAAKSCLKDSEAQSCDDYLAGTAVASCADVCTAD